LSPKMVGKRATRRTKATRKPGRRISRRAKKAAPLAAPISMRGIQDISFMEVRPAVLEPPAKSPEKRALLNKLPTNPIIAPNPSHRWEAYQTFNAGAILLDGRVHLLYRAIGVDGISRFGYASSSDGFNVDERLPYPVYERKMERLSFSPSASGGGFGGCEDPRIIKIEEDGRIYVTYNAFGPGELRVGFTSIRVDDFLSRRWRWSEERLISPPGEVHKNFVIFPEKINGRYAILHSISPKIRITYLDSLEFDDGIYINSYHKPHSNGNGWEVAVKSPGPPPIKTSDGWLLLYHGLDKREPWKYKIGLMLLDLDNPERILAVSRYPIIEADQSYENIGFKPGIVYTNGAVVKDGELIVYYGSADTYVSAAYIPLDEILDYLRREMELTRDIDKEKLLLLNGSPNGMIIKSHA